MRGLLFGLIVVAWLHPLGAAAIDPSGPPPRQAERAPPSPARTPAPQPPDSSDPCVQARADWMGLQTSTTLSVLQAFRQSVPAACVVQRAQADARIQELTRPAAVQTPSPAVAAPLPPASVVENSATSMASPATSPGTPGARAFPIWTRIPSPQTLSEIYPSRARDANMEGRVDLECLIRADLSAECHVVSESPRGFGFGDAARRALDVLQAAPALTDGRSAIGSRSIVTIHFRTQSGHQS
jgi:hypothetical protein